MIGWLKEKLLGPSVDCKELLLEGAILLDVRSAGEFGSGNARGSINISLEALDHKIDKLKKMNKPIVTCCASGVRSGLAASKLKTQGLEAFNGGSWSKYA